MAGEFQYLDSFQSLHLHLPVAGCPRSVDAMPRLSQKGLQFGQCLSYMTDRKKMTATGDAAPLRLRQQFAQLLAGAQRARMFGVQQRSEEHTSELQSVKRISYTVF